MVKSLCVYMVIDELGVLYYHCLCLKVACDVNDTCVLASYKISSNLNVVWSEFVLILFVSV